MAIGGIGWGRTEAACAARLGRIGESGISLLLSHNPRAFPAAAGSGVALTLSGHTHGGQIAFPARPQVNLALGYRHSAGLFARDASRLFVTTGIGSWFPLRVNCPPEVALLTVHEG